VVTFGSTITTSSSPLSSSACAARHAMPQGRRRLPCGMLNGTSGVLKPIRTCLVNIVRACEGPVFRHSPEGFFRTWGVAGRRGGGFEALPPPPSTHLRPEPAPPPSSRTLYYEKIFWSLSWAFSSLAGNRAAGQRMCWCISLHLRLQESIEQRWQCCLRCRQGRFPASGGSTTHPAPRRKGLAMAPR